MVWETPCGLLAGGKHFLIGHMSYRGIDWTPENGNPVLSCPVFPSAPCPLQDPLLSSCRLNLHPDNVVYHEIKEPVVEFPTCEKVKQMKMFKNNRVDSKFRTSEYAGQFAGKYLGTVS